MAERNSAAAEVVSRHLDGDPVALERADAVLLHLASRLSQNDVFVLELHAVVAVRKHLRDDALEFDEIFFRHVDP